MFMGRFWVCLVCVTVVFGCARKTPEQLLSEAKAVQDIHLDSANMLLDQIVHPEHLPDTLQIQYNRIRINYLTHVTMEWDKADSLNNLLLEFCLQKKDTVNYQDVLFFAGLINFYRDSLDKAGEHFFAIKEWAEKQDEKAAIRNAYYHLAHVYLKKKEPEKALYYTEKMQPLYEAGDSLREINRFRLLKSIYVQMNRTDSAMIQLQKIQYRVGGNPDYRRLLSHLYTEMCELLLAERNYREALYYADLSIQNRTNRKDISHFNLTKARVFMMTHQMDSAVFYLRRTIESADDNFIAIAAYDYLSDIYRQSGNYEQAYYQRLNYNDAFERRESDLSTNLLMYKYREEKLKNENNELKLAKREREVLILWVVLISVLAIVALLFYLFEYRKKKRLQEHILTEKALKAQSRVMENENKLLRQENELMTLREKSALLRESLFRKMSVATKIPSLNPSDEEEGKGKYSEKHKENKKYEEDKGFPSNKPHVSGRIRLDEPDWKELTNTVDELFNHFATRLTHDYPELNKEDVAFCCLVKINVSMQDLADIYCISKAGITKKKTRMKKDKFHIHDETISLDHFLATF